ncbi:two-component system sensor histidine kinase, partial [gut metagenome]
NLEARSELNFASLTAFAGEDKEASISIMKTFTEETRKSIEALRVALKEGSREDSSRISHKMIPLFSMLGANTLVQHLRILEKNDDELTDQGWNHLLDSVIKQASLIVEDAEAAMKR